MIVTVPDKENNVLLFFNSLWKRLTSKFQSRQSQVRGERYDIGLCELSKGILWSYTFFFVVLSFSLHEVGFLQMLSSKDINFVGYTYKNVEIVNDDQLTGIGIQLLTSS